MPKSRLPARQLDALLRKLKTIRGLYASAPEAIFITRPERKLDCNQAAMRLFGYRRKAEFLAMPRGETSPPRQPDGRPSAATARAFHNRALRQGHVKYTWVYRRRDGTDFPAEVVLARFVLDGHKLIRATVRDLTHEHRIEAERAASEARFRNLADAHPVPFAVISATEDRFLYVSEASARVYQMPRSRLLKARPSSFWVDADARRRGREFMAKQGRIDAMRVRMRRGDGSEYWASMSGQLIDYDGQPAFAASIRDLTAELAAETALRESEERFRQIAELHPVPMVINDRAWNRYLYASPAAARMLRTTAEKMLEMSPIGFWPDPAEMRVAGAELYRRGSLDDYEARLRRADGEEVWISATIRPVEYRGEPAWLNALVDITPRKQMASALHESEERFRAMAEANPVALTVHSTDQPRLLYVNAAFTELYGDSRESLLSRPMSELWVDQGERARFRRRLREGGHVDEFIAQHRRANGEAFWTSISARSLVYEGKPCFISTARDLTQQRAAEAAVRDSERRFRELLEQHPSPMVVTSFTEDRVLYVSKAGERLLGMSAERALATPASWFWASQADRDQVRRILRDGGTIDELEVRLRRAEGSEYWASISGRAFDYQGQPALFMTGRDLTRQRETEAEVERQRAALDQSAKMAAMGSLLASVSHELNNPLAVVMAQAELLRELAAGSAMAARAETIHAAAERCGRIVRTFLALARQKPPARRAYDLNEVARSTVELLGYGLKSAGVAVRLDLAPNLPPLHGDADQMAQVLSNLLINAQQAMQSHTGPRRLVVATRLASSGKRVRLRVTDSGPGVPREIRARIFEPFFTTKPVGTGTGIGLALCHNIVAGHGGTIALEDPNGGGTRFVIVLPAEAPPAEIPLPAAITAVPKRAEAILVVDDEPQLLATIAEILAPLAERVDRTADGRQAMELIERHGYTVILSDLRMPDLDGPALHAAIASSRPELLNRLVFITGDSLGMGVEAFLASSGAPVLEKPFSADELRRVVTQVLGSNR